MTCGSERDDETLVDEKGQAAQTTFCLFLLDIFLLYAKT